MNAYIKRARDLCYILMFTLFLLLTYFYLDEIISKNTSINVFAIIFIILISVFDYLSRDKIKNVILFIFVHLLFFLFGFIVSKTTSDIFILSGFSLIYFILGISFWKTDVSDKRPYAIDIPIEGIIVFIGIYIHSSYNMSTFLSGCSLIFGIGFFSLNFIRTYLDKFITQTLSKGQLSPPLKKTFKVNFIFIILFILTTILLIASFISVFSNDSFNFIGRILKAIAGFFLGFLTRLKPEQIPLETTALPDNISGNVNETLPSPSVSTTGSNPFFEQLFNAMAILIYIFVVAAIIYVVYLFIKNYFFRINDNNDIIEKIDNEESYILKKKKNKTKQPSIFLSNKNKIRKLYFSIISKYVKQNTKICINASSTPNDIKNTLFSNLEINKENYEEFSRIYNESRYSNHEITKEYVNAAKELSKHL